MKTALLAGATGLVGGQVLRLLVEDDYYTTIKCIVRKPLLYNHPKIESIPVHFESLYNVESLLAADDVFCCLGTTMKKAGSKQAFRKVDYHYPLALAKLAKRRGARQYLIVSSLGANTSSSLFYSRVKGEIEESIAQIGFESYHIFRPSLLLGARAEKRFTEGISQTLSTLLKSIIPLKYRAIDATAVARAMITLAKQNQKGIFFHESGTLQHYI